MNLLEVVIFSFNRGKLLRNCVLSIRSFMPGVPITVFDDGSTDRETVAILDDLGRERWVKVLKPQVSARLGNSGDTNGRLHENMQSFFDVCARKTWALVLQDDTAIVRSFTADDREIIKHIFESYPRSAFIYPAFLTYRELYGHVDIGSLRAGDPSYSFLREYEFSGYFDVCLAHVDRLRAAGWHWVNESAASICARERFGTMRLMRRPFVGHLPAPPTYRNRRKTWTQRIWEGYRAGLYPIDPLTDSEVNRLFSLRDTFPTAESFLTSRSFGESHPWPYSRLEGAPASLRALDRIENALRRRMNRRGAWLLNTVFGRSG